MNIKQKINADYLAAFKEKNTELKSLLGTLKGEIQTLEKNNKIENLSDEDTLKILNKFAKNLRENIKLVNDEKSKSELIIIESYLPKNLSNEEIQEKINQLINLGITNMGAIMKEFSSLPADKKLVSELIKKSI